MLALQRGGFGQLAGKAKQQTEEVAEEALALCDAQGQRHRALLPACLVEPRKLFGGAKKAKQEVEETVEEESSKP